MAEGGELTFTISASDPTLDRDLTVNLQVTEDTSMGQSYLDSAERGSKRAILPAGLVTTTYTVKTAYTMITEGFMHDDVDEPDGTVTVTLRPGTGYTVGATDAASGMVTDNDPTVVDLILEDTTVPENGGKVDIKYRIVNGPLKAGQTIAFKAGEIDWGPTKATRVNHYGTNYTLRLKPGSINRGVTLTTTAPYSEATPLLTMSGAGVREATLELTAIDDSENVNSQVYLSIGTATDGVVVTQLGSVAKTLDNAGNTSFRKVGHPSMVTLVRSALLPEIRSDFNSIHFINDESTGDNRILFVDSAYRVNESDGFVQAKIIPKYPHNYDRAMPLNFTAGTATAGADYRTATAQTVLKPNFTSDLTIPIVDDRHKEGNETFTVTINVDPLPDLRPDDPNSTGWITDSLGIATITIVDDDGDVHASVRALDSAATEGSASDKARFRVSLDSVRGAAGPLTDGDAATIAFSYAGGELGKDFDVNLLTEHDTVTSDGASVKFNPTAGTPTPRFADFELIAREDNDDMDDVVTVTLAGDTGIPSGVGSGTGVTVSGSGSPTGTSSGEARITLRDDDREPMGLRLRGALNGPVADDDGVFSIGEGNNATFFFGLTEAPTADVTATASIVSGGYAAAITSGASHTLEPHTTSWMCSQCPWRVEFRYNYNTQSGTLHGKQIVINAMEDIATVPTDDVTLRIVLSIGRQELRRRRL